MVLEIMVLYQAQICMMQGCKKNISKNLRRFLDKTKDSIEITSINGEFYNLVEIRQTVNEYYYKFVPNFGKEIIYSSKVPIPGYQIGKSYILGFFPK